MLKKLKVWLAKRAEKREEKRAKERSKILHEMQVLTEQIISNQCIIELKEKRPYEIVHLKDMQKINCELLAGFWSIIFSNNRMGIIDECENIQKEVEKRTGLKFELSDETSRLNRIVSSI